MLLSSRIPQISHFWVVQHCARENWRLEAGAGAGERCSWRRSGLEIIPAGPRAQLGDRARCHCLVLSGARGLEGGVVENCWLLFYAGAEQTQINRAKSASTILKDLILWIIKYPLERKILIGLQSCE